MFFILLAINCVVLILIVMPLFLVCFVTVLFNLVLLGQDYFSWTAEEIIPGVVFIYLVLIDVKIILL